MSLNELLINMRNLRKFGSVGAMKTIMSIPIYYVNSPTSTFSWEKILMFCSIGHAKNRNCSIQNMKIETASSTLVEYVLEQNHSDVSFYLNYVYM